MSNKNPATRIVNYPSKFKPLLDQELDQKGFYSYSELMGHILAEHYGISPKNTNNKKGKPAAGIKITEVKEA